jgi:hypothetical protein
MKTQRNIFEHLAHCRAKEIVRFLEVEGVSLSQWADPTSSLAEMATKLVLSDARNAVLQEDDPDMADALIKEVPWVVSRFIN